MIAYVEGQIISIDPTYVVVLVNGVGYQILLSKRDLDNFKEGENASFHVHTNVREDAIELYGFKSREQKQVFQLLISVSGVGPKLGLAMLSTLSSSDLVNALIENNLALLSSIPGIGKKTAERLHLELRDKAQKLDVPVALSVSQSSATSLQQALRGLGYSRDQCERALAKIEQADFNALPLESLIKKTLNLLTGSK